MLEDRGLKLFVIALKASAAINVGLVISEFFINYTKPLTGIAKVVNHLGRPGGIMAQRLVPGHDTSTVLAAILCSIVFYAAVVWIGLFLGSYFKAGRARTDASQSE